MELIARFALNVFCGSLFSFYLTCLLTLLFRPLIQLPRALYLLFLFPFAKMTYDLLFLSHTHWVLKGGTSILNQPENSRTLSALIGPFVEVKLSLHNGQLFSLGDVIAEIAGKPLTLLLGLSLIFITLVSVIRFALHLRKNMRWKKALLNESWFYDRFNGTAIYVTTKTLKSPILVGICSPFIVCSQSLLETFSDEEKVAVFSHETGHMKWKDNLVNGVLHLISAFFWFIPFKKFVLKKAAFYREVGCDLKSDPLHLVTALKKTDSIDLPLGCIAFSSCYSRIKWNLKRKKAGSVQATLSLLFFLGGAVFIFGSRFLPF